VLACQYNLNVSGAPARSLVFFSRAVRLSATALRTLMEAQLHVTTNSVLLFPNTAGTWDKIRESNKGTISAHNACSRPPQNLQKQSVLPVIICPRFAIVK